MRSSATRPPDFIVVSTLIPAIANVSIDIEEEAADADKLTERCSFLDISTEEVASADRVELREAREQALALGSFTNARCTKEDNSSSLVQSHSRRSATFSTGAMYTKID